MMKEFWKLITYRDLPPLYYASNLGRIKRVRHSTQTVNQFGVHEVTRDEKIYSFCKNSQGYCLWRIQQDNVSKAFTVHRIIAHTFIPNPEGKPCVNHLDLDKTNNCVSNLEWATYSENSLHAVREGALVTKKGISSNLSRYSEEQVREVYRLCKQGMSQSKAGERVGMPRPTVASIMQKVSWKEVTDSVDKEYNE